MGTVADMSVFETYPVLTMIALGWMPKDDERTTSRLPRYNPKQQRTFSISDWQHVCRRVCGELPILPESVISHTPSYYLASLARSRLVSASFTAQRTGSIATP